jgi:hypothetical protein
MEKTKMSISKNITTRKKFEKNNYFKLEQNKISELKIKEMIIQKKIQDTKDNIYFKKLFTQYFKNIEEVKVDEDESSFKREENSIVIDIKNSAGDYTTLRIRFTDLGLEFPPF